LIVVDTSVLIDHFRGRRGAPLDLFATVVDREQVLIGDIMVLEILQGAGSHGEARRLESLLAEFEVAEMMSLPLAVRAADNYRRLRDIGVTLRATADLIIGTYCIEHGHSLLHSDRDFDAMRDHLGLKTL
jgi:predicted nucleic acid-binding protein